MRTCKYGYARKVIPIKTTKKKKIAKLSKMHANVTGVTVCGQETYEIKNVF